MDHYEIAVSKHNQTTGSYPDPCELIYPNSNRSQPFLPFCLIKIFEFVNKFLVTRISAPNSKNGKYEYNHDSVLLWLGERNKPLKNPIPCHYFEQRQQPNDVKYYCKT